MKKLALALAPALILSGCVTTQSYSRTIDGGPAQARPWYRDGRVETIRENVRRTQGDPAGGAVAGALVGGLLGHALTGHGGGAVVGALGGAMVGAGASQGGTEERNYEVFVRFEDGALGRFLYQGYPPWRSGDEVRQTANGLVARPQDGGGDAYGAARPAPPPPPQDSWRGW